LITQYQRKPMRLPLNQLEVDWEKLAAHAFVGRRERTDYQCKNSLKS
jgi:hypothetical protein